MELSLSGSAVPGDLVDFVERDPGEPDRTGTIFDVERCVHGAESDFAAAIGADDDRGGLAEIEVVAIPIAAACGERGCVDARTFTNDILIHVAGFNLGVLMRALFGYGTPKKAACARRVPFIVIHTGIAVAIVRSPRLMANWPCSSLSSRQRWIEP